MPGMTCDGLTTHPGGSNNTLLLHAMETKVELQPGIKPPGLKDGVYGLWT